MGLAIPVSLQLSPLMSVILFAWLIISIPATLVIGAALGFASNRGGSLKPASPMASRKIGYRYPRIRHAGWPFAKFIR